MKLIVTVGIPGSGKSRWASSQIGYKVVSPDSFRSKLGNVSDQSKNDTVYYMCRKQILDYLNQGFDVIYDSTCLGRGQVRNLRKMSEDTGCEIYYKIFYCDPVVAKARIRADVDAGIDRSNVPDEIIDQMHIRFQRIISNLEGEK